MILGGARSQSLKRQNGLAVDLVRRAPASKSVGAEPHAVAFCAPPTDSGTGVVPSINATACGLLLHGDETDHLRF